MVLSMVVESPADELRSIDELLQESEEERQDRALVRFYRHVLYITCKDALACSKAQPDAEEPKQRKERQDMQSWLRTTRFRRLCSGLGYDYWKVESTIRGIIAGGDAQRVQQLFEEYSASADHYAKRSSGRPPRAKDGDAGAQPLSVSSATRSASLNAH